MGAGGGGYVETSLGNQVPCPCLALEESYCFISASETRVVLTCGKVNGTDGALFCMLRCAMVWSRAHRTGTALSWNGARRPQGLASGAFIRGFIILIRLFIATLRIGTLPLDSGH